MSPRPEPWLRGPLPGIPAELQPVAHALTAALEDVESVVDGLSPEQLWARPGGAASIGFHLMHLSGSTDRLLTYARGQSLSDAQRAALAFEQAPEPKPPLDALRRQWRTTVERVHQQLARTIVAMLGDPREVGRAGLPSTVRGILFHAAEHAQRHVGQIVATAKVVRAASSPGETRS